MVGRYIDDTDEALITALNYITDDVICFYIVMNNCLCRQYKQFLVTFNKMTNEYKNERYILLDKIKGYYIQNYTLNFIECRLDVNMIGMLSYTNILHAIDEESDIFKYELLYESINFLAFRIYAVKPSANYIKLLDMK
jgi:hypothetical protein